MKKNDISPELKEKFMELKIKQMHKYMILKINEETKKLEIDKLGIKNSQFEDMTKDVLPNSPW